ARRRVGHRAGDRGERGRARLRRQLSRVDRGRKWLVLPLAVSGFLFQHATEGWCPPVPLLRRLGFRTSFEIQEERQAPKALRGDFDAVAKSANAPAAALKAVRG